MYRQIIFRSFRVLGSSPVRCRQGALNRLGQGLAPTAVLTHTLSSTNHTVLKRGFTLIELLVVIAIIGILASVVLSSLNDARQRGQDAAITANINNMRSEAETWYDINSFSYTDLCIQSEILNASTSVANAGGSFVCESSGSEFRISSALVNTSEYFCVDNNGFAGKLTTAPTGSQCN